MKLLVGFLTKNGLTLIARPFLVIYFIGALDDLRLFH